MVAWSQALCSLVTPGQNDPLPTQDYQALTPTSTSLSMARPTIASLCEPLLIHEDPG